MFTETDLFLIINMKVIFCVSLLLLLVSWSYAKKNIFEELRPGKSLCSKLKIGLPSKQLFSECVGNVFLNFLSDDEFYCLSKEAKKIARASSLAYDTNRAFT